MAEGLLLTRPVERNWPVDVDSEFKRDMFNITSEFDGYKALPETFSVVSKRLGNLINDYKARGYMPETDEGFIIGVRAGYGERNDSMIVTLQVEPFHQLVLDE